ncbi:DUF805 domain-containing protein [Dactylosporangium sp. NPDC051541]|uniref:DUF805 domain-containing protein n=1 Tax=Dactylosporangium sp. NPDC051541 TaxID=3363977 RepID=UPI00378A2E0C
MAIDRTSERPPPLRIALAVMNWSVDWQGRAPRWQFWTYAASFWVFCAVMIEWTDRTDSDPAWFGWVFFALCLPLIALAVRRLHDSGRSGAWALLAFSAIGMIALIVLWCLPSQPDPNRYGATSTSLGGWGLRRSR